MESNSSTKNKRGIARRLIVYIFIFSSAITFFMTSLQLYLDYSREVKLIEERMQQVKNSYLPSIIRNLWVANESLLKIQLEGVLRLPDMKYLEIRIRGGSDIVLGTLQAKRSIKKEFPLYYRYRSQDVFLGTLNVTATLDEIYQRLIDKILVIMVTQAVKTFLVSIFIFFLFYYLVGRHLNLMARYARAIDPKHLGKKLSLSRTPSKLGDEDELDEVVFAINQMQSNLAMDMEESQEAEAAFQTLVASTVGTTGQECYDKIVTELCRWFGAECAFVGILDQKKVLRALALQLDGEHIGEFRQNIENTPYEQTVAEGAVIFQENISDRFSTDRALSRFKAESYAGACIRGIDGNLIGLIGVISRHKMKIPARAKNVLEIIATKAASEIERSRSEKALVESEKHLSAVISNVPGIVYRVSNDRPRSMEFINEGCVDLLGYEAKEFFGDDRIFYSEIIHREDLELVRKGVNDALAQGRSYELRYKIVTKNGKTKWVFERGLALYSEEGNIEALEGVITDITSMKNADEDRDRLEAHLQQSQKMEAIGTMAGGIAHDFNNMLSAISGYTELSLLEAPESSVLQDNLFQVLTAGQRAKKLVQQILAFSRKAPQDKKPLEITPILDETIKFLRASLPSTIEIITKVDSNLGSILADETQIQQVLMNLATNAAQAMEQNGGTLEISARQMVVSSTIINPLGGIKPGKYLLISVKDDGVGITPETMERIFEPYFTTKEPGAGTGMGMAVVHGIVRSHNGGITINSEIGRGAEFVVFLPLIEGQIKDREILFNPDLPIGHENILFVDDEAALAKMTGQMLKRLGYNVTVLDSSPDALAIFRENPQSFDLVITDQTMPKMTGADLSLELLKIKPDIPIIICTGFSDALSAESAESMGIKSFLMKPLAIKVLAEKVRQVLDAPQAGNVIQFKRDSK